MKIVLISFLYDPQLGGGAAKVVYDLANGMVEAGNDVTVITTSTKNDEKILFDGRIKIYKIHAPNLYWIYEKGQQSKLKKIIFQLIDIWNPFVKRKVKLILQKEKPDIVHIHKLRGLSPSVWTAAKESKVQKIIHTCHDYELISPQGLLIGNIGSMAKKGLFPLNYYQKIRAHASNVITDVIAPSKAIFQIHDNFGFFNHAKENIIPNSHGIPIREITNNKLSINKPKSDSLVVSYIGRIVQEKGIEFACNVIKSLNTLGYQINFNVIGSGEFSSHLIENYSESSTIRFFGEKYGSDKKELQQNSDVLLFPSLVPESFGIAITEAFAYGKPVIASNIGAIPEIVKDGFNGFLFEPNNKNQLQEIILRIYRDKTLLTNMRNNCFQSAEEYCLENFINNHLNIYNE